MGLLQRNLSYSHQAFGSSGFPKLNAFPVWDFSEPLVSVLHWNLQVEVHRVGAGGEVVSVPAERLGSNLGPIIGCHGIG